MEKLLRTPTLSRLQLDDFMDAIDPITQKDCGCRVVECRWLEETATLQVFVEGSGGDTRIDVVTAATFAIDQAVEDWINVAGPCLGGYTLEVSSPGIERPLRRLSDFKSHQGRLVRILFASGLDFEGFLVVDEDLKEPVAQGGECGQTAPVPQVGVETEGGVCQWGALTMVKEAHLVHSWNAPHGARAQQEGAGA